MIIIKIYAIYIYMTENGTDIILDDRKQEFIKNNMSLRESTCDSKDYIFKTKKVSCECKVKTKISVISEIVNNKDDLLKKFIDIKLLLNLDVIKCFKLVFSSEGIKNNIGSYILLIILFLCIIFLFIFLIKGYNLLYNKIFKIILNSKNKKIKKIKIK